MKKSKTHSFKHFKLHAEIFLVTIGLILIANASYSAFYGNKMGPIGATETKDLASKNPCNNDMAKFESEKFNYFFCYPKKWYSIIYNELDETIKVGTNSFFSYNYKQAVTFTKKGSVDWQSFVGNEPQVKFDVNVISETNFDKSKVKLNEIVLVYPKQTNDISTTSIWSFEKLLGNNVISLSIYTYNHKNYEQLLNSNNWSSLQEIVKSLAN